MANNQSSVANCGCVIKDVNGNVSERVMNALVFETNRIQKYGYESLMGFEHLIDSEIPKRAVSPGEGESPRTLLRYRMGLANDDYATSDFFATGDASITMAVNTPTGVQNITTRGNNLGSAGCDNRSVTLVGGFDTYGKSTVMLPDIQTECFCIVDFYRKENFAAVLAALRESMPREAMRMRERAMFRQALALAGNVTAEAGNNAPNFAAGRFPYLPVGGPQINTFKRLHQRLSLYGHRGPLTIPISATALQSMMVHYYQQFGIGMQVNAWAQGQFPLGPDGTYTHEGILRFKIIDMPVVGYFKEVANNRVEFFPYWDRVFRAGTGSGVTYDANADYLETTAVINGVEYELYEVVPVFGRFEGSKAPLYQEGIGMTGGTDKASLQAAMWNGTQVRTIGGAFIPNNEKEMKWYHQLSQAYTLGAEYPEVASFVAWKRQSYTYSLNVVGISPDKLAVSSQTIAINPGKQGNATSQQDINAGLDPTHPAPDAYVGGCTTGSNTNGKIRAMCAAVVDEGAGTITITAERIDGDNGDASVAYAVDDGTGIAGTDYTDTSGTLSWAAGEYGVKSFTITIPATARHGKTFSVGWSSFTGASNVSSGCTTTSITIKRNPKNYRLGNGLVGALLKITADGGDWLTGNFDGPQDAQALETAINDLLNGDGVAEVTWGTDWNIEIVGTHTVFTSASDDDPSTVNCATF